LFSIQISQEIGHTLSFKVFAQVEVFGALEIWH